MRENLTDYQENWIDRHYDDPDAQEKLEDEFFDVVTEDIYRELKNYLALNQSISDAFKFHLDLAKDIASISDYHDNFSGAILDIEALLKIEIDSRDEHCFYRLLYANVITALETYLYVAFMGTVNTNPDLMRQFIETTPEFKNKKIPLSEAFEAKDKAEEEANVYLDKLVWHNIKRVKQMYKDTLGIDFPEDISAIFQAIETRHDIIHRNGRTKEGDKIIITENDISELIVSIETCVRTIDAELAKLQPNTHTQDKYNGL